MVCFQESEQRGRVWLCGAATLWNHDHNSDLKKGRNFAFVSRLKNYFQTVLQEVTFSLRFLCTVWCFYVLYVVFYILCVVLYVLCVSCFSHFDHVNSISVYVCVLKSRHFQLLVYLMCVATL